MNEKNTGIIILRHMRAILLLLSLLIVSCTFNNVVKNTSNNGGGASIERDFPPPPPFVLGSGDEVAIRVWRNEDLNRDVKIDPSGKIHLPLVGEITASGLTVSQLREEITSHLGKYIINPHVDINVYSLKSQKVHVLGEVKSPGTFTLEANTMAWEAISKAGGFTTDANKKKVLLVRSGEDAVAVTALNIHDMLHKGKAIEDTYLRSGDVIYVPPSFIANVERFMTRFNNIINPFVTLERGIVLYPDALDVIKGEEDKREIFVVP